jgi:hypothetical protein
MHHYRILAIIGASVFGTLLLILTLLYVLRPEARQASQLPADTVKQVEGFTVYYPNPLPRGFQLDTKTASYSNGVLQFQLKSRNGQTISFSEQKLPDDLRASQVVGKESVPTEHGNATVSLVDGRSIGYLLTKDTNSMVLVHTNDKVESSTFKDILRGLEPVKR